MIPTTFDDLMPLSYYAARDISTSLYATMKKNPGNVTDVIPTLEEKRDLDWMLDELLDSFETDLPYEKLDKFARDFIYYAEITVSIKKADTEITGLDDTEWSPLYYLTNILVPGIKKLSPEDLELEVYYQDEKKEQKINVIMHVANIAMHEICEEWLEERRQ